jgi:Na+/melibiose symporter-like transporter
VSKVADERAKLTANLLNSAATGVFITGVVAPIVAAFYGVAGPSEVGLGWIALASTVCVLMVFGLHLGARAVLGRLSE